jgi:hypothetical protein
MKEAVSYTFLMTVLLACLADVLNYVETMAYVDRSIIPHILTMVGGVASVLIAKHIGDRAAVIAR